MTTGSTPIMRTSLLLSLGIGEVGAVVVPAWKYASCELHTDALGKFHLWQRDWGLVIMRTVTPPVVSPANPNTDGSN